MPMLGLVLQSAGVLGVPWCWRKSGVAQVTKWNSPIRRVAIIR